MDYVWYPAYREAILETDNLKIRRSLFFAEQQMVERLYVLAQDHGGTAEERQAIAHALLGLKSLRTEIPSIPAWKRPSGM